MSERRRTKAEQMLDLLEGMTRKDMRDFGALICDHDSALAQMFLRAMRQGAAAPSSLFVSPEVGKALLEDLLAKDPGVVEPMRGPCQGHARGYALCGTIGEYGTMPNLPSNRCAKCHHDSACHGK